MPFIRQNAKPFVAYERLYASPALAETEHAPVYQKLCPIVRTAPHHRGGGTAIGANGFARREALVLKKRLENMPSPPRQQEKGWENLGPMDSLP